MLEHGGRLHAASCAFKIPLESWLDLSTGISPWCYPIPAIPQIVWHRLPDPDDALEAIAAQYYGNDRLLATAGSQASIQALPRMFQPDRITIIGPTYNEHAAAWRAAGHTVQFVTDLKAAVAAASPVTLLCNPNNPTTTTIHRAALLKTAQQLNTDDGWLIVDEAYGDFQPGDCVTPDAGASATPRLITLRSLGKFFGLAGARVGFVFGDDALRNRLNELLGPWTINGPARYVAERALADKAWQAQQQQRIRAAGEQLHALLFKALPRIAVKSTALFSTCTLPSVEAAENLYQHLAQRGILVRLFAAEQLVRIGIPGASDWPRLTEALHSWHHLSTSS
jgi:cobalamin biosynthetic protein CobC